MAYKAVFLDRDDTIIDDPGYLADPAGLKILPGVSLAIKSLRQAGYKIVVVTNQSGIARGLLTEETLEQIHAKLREDLADKGAMIDAIYYCPFHPDGSVDKYRRESDLRKPEPGMLLKAAEQLNLDLASSWMVGDSSRDIQAGKNAGCRTIQVTSHITENSEDDVKADTTARNLVEAARIIMHAQDITTPQPETQEPVDDSDQQTDYNEPEEPQEAPQMADYDNKQNSDPQERPEVQKPAFTLTRPEIDNSQADDDNHDSKVRREILQHVRQISKQSQHEEFSLISLLGGLTQVITILFLVMAMWKGFNDADPQRAIMWGIIAMTFQTMSLTFFTMSKKSK